MASGEGVLSGLVSRGGASLASAGETQMASAGKSTGTAGKLFKDLIGDMLMGSIGGKRKQKPDEESEADREERFRRRTQVPSAADLFGHNLSRPPAPQQTVPMAKVPFAGRPAAVGSAGSATPTPAGQTTFVPAAAQPNRQPGAPNPIGPLKQFGNLITKTLGPLGKQLAFTLKLNTGLYSITKSLELFVWGVSESNRSLSRWNGQIAASFAKLDIANMRREIETGEATSGSATAVNTAFNDLLQEMQPIRQDISTIVNSVGVVAAKIAQGAATVIKWHPMVMAISFAARKIEENTKKSDTTGTDPMTDFIKAFDPKFFPGPAAPPTPIPPPAWIPPIV